MRLIVADCSIEYSGRLTAYLAPARRLIIVKDDGTVIVHADHGHKALNWMSAPCRIVETDGAWTVYGASGEKLDISISQIHSDSALPLGEEPGLLKTGSEAELQMLLAANPNVIEPGLRLISREYPTAIGPVDLLCRDATDGAVAIEVKRVAELLAVEQLTRYLDLLNQDASLSPVRGLLVAQVVKPQTRTLATARGLGWVEVDFAVLSGAAEPDPTLF